MGRYAATFGLLGFLTTVTLAFFNQAPVPEVLSKALFWTVVCALFGVVASIAAKRLVQEIELPSIEEEIEAEQHQRELAKYRKRMSDLAELYPSSAREPLESQEKSPDLPPTTDNAEEGESSPEPQPQTAG